MFKATIETLYITGVSLIISYAIALVLGSIMSETRPVGLFPNKIINWILNRFVDIFRSIPFILLVVLLFPFTRLIIGTAIGNNAMIVALVVCAVPFEMRLIEEILAQISPEIIEAAKLDGANNLQIIFHMKWLSKKALLINSACISFVNILGYSAMAGIIGGGGLGNYAIVYGFQRFRWWIIFWSVLIIVLIVFFIQSINNFIVRRLEK